MVEIRDFNSPFDYPNPMLRSHMGYIYGQCARKLYYCNKYGKTQFTSQEIKAMEGGTNAHRKLEEQWLKEHPFYVSEKQIIRTIPDTYGITRVGATVDLVSFGLREVIEIKPMYTRKAYYQTMIQKFVFPTFKFYVLQYAIPEEEPDYIINIKANPVMANVYVGRIITALLFKPPRFPNAKYNSLMCKNCLYRERCYSETESTWGDFKEKAEYAIQRVSSIRILSDNSI